MGDNWEGYIDRLCWKCKKPLTFQDFYITNKSLGKEKAIEFWQSPLFEFFCCSCFRIEEHKRYEEIRKRVQDAHEQRQELVKRELLERITGKKILILGIQNTGKTALLNVLQDRGLFRIFNLLPTRGWSIEDIFIHNLRFITWDLGGVERYRLKWINLKELIFSETEEIIYLIDIQDTSSYIDSIRYLSDIIQALNLQQIKDSLNSRFYLNILFHKADPEIINSPKSMENINFLTNCIDNLEIPFNYEINKTSLFNFQRNYTEELFEQSNQFGTLISDLFSSSSA